jgi:protein-S-isoprenylcysteine O-methyltransferase Ste14
MYMLTNRKLVNRIVLAFLLIALTGSSVIAQNAEMADEMRANGKIYVVVAIILVVLAGLILYLFLQDKKLNELERLIREKKQTK